MGTTPNPGLYKFGQDGWRGDGTDAEKLDQNSDIVTQSVTDIYEKIQTVIIEGGGDANFVFVQNVASATWVIQHNLGKYPAVTVIDSSGHQVLGDVNHTNTNALTIFFSAPFAGSASLN